MSSMNDPVRVKLSEEELVELGQQMALKVRTIDGLREKKKSDAKATQDQIDAELEELAELAEKVLEGEEETTQAELFAGDNAAGVGDRPAES